MWGQPPSAVRRAQLDAFLCYPRRASPGGQPMAAVPTYIPTGKRTGNLPVLFFGLDSDQAAGCGLLSALAVHPDGFSAWLMKETKKHSARPSSPSFLDWTLSRLPAAFCFQPLPSIRTASARD